MRSGLVSNIKQLLLPRGEALRTIRLGCFRGLKMNLDLASQTQVYLGLFERELYRPLEKLAKGVRTAIDIGAAHGEYTLYFLVKTQATTVYAFEPSLELRARLLSNVHLNTPVSGVRLKLSGKYVGCSTEANTCNLDSLVPMTKSPCLVKIDIDGGEVDVLKGAEKFLQLPQIRWIVETHSPKLESDCISMFERAGYHAQIIGNAWWRYIVPEQRPIEQNRWLIAIKE